MQLVEEGRIFAKRSAEFHKTRKLNNKSGGEDIEHLLVNASDLLRRSQQLNELTVSDVAPSPSSSSAASSSTPKVTPNPAKILLYWFTLK